jgi:prepilin-type processing-associated H-X9-DG protein
MAEVPDFTVPTREQIVLTPEGEELEALQKTLGGSYSMSLGFEQDHCYHGLRNLGDNDFALVSDVPDAASPDFRSHNHAGGRNVLFGGGNVRYLVVPVATVAGDHVYLNAAGRVGLGLGAHDSVIPPAGRLPIVYTSNH